jgi:hypothetical protein
MTSRLPLDWKQIDSVTLLEAGGERRGDGVVCVPYRLMDGSTFRSKLFPYGGGSYWGPGEGLTPFGLERLPAAATGRIKRLIWMAEGESDALCLREHYAAWRGYPVDVLGLPGAGSWRDEWARYATGYKGVYVFPDADPAGERMAAAVTASVRWAVVVYLPAGDDVRALVQRDGPDALDEQIVEAERVAILYAAIRLHLTLDAARRWLRTVTL